jgi:CheY-like chemotaxis protein
MQTSVLGKMLCPESAPSEVAAVAVRRLLRETLESLRPSATVPFGQHEWISYRLISLRYIQRRDLVLVCDELGISRSSYYRYHQQALEAITSVLWEKVRHLQADASEQEVVDSQPIAQSASELASRLGRDSQAELILFPELLEDAVRTIRPLIDQQGIYLELHVPEILPPAYADPSLLRQALLGLLADIIPRMAPGCLSLRVEALGPKIVCHLHGSWAADRDIDWESMNGLALARELFRVHGGSMHIDYKDEEPAIIITTLKAGQETILIIDDDDDTVRLYSRWLEGARYVVLVAQKRAVLEQHLSRSIPDAILLDVLMPQWDGWSVLQQLRLDPKWARIPIIVCSVLGQPRLALALGATAVLRKPISEDLLLTTVRKALDREGSPD